MSMQDVMSNVIMTVLNLKINLDGKKLPYLQNIKISGGIDNKDDLLLTVDGEMMVLDTEESNVKNYTVGLNAVRIKTELNPVTNELVPVKTTLQAEAIKKGCTRVIVKSIESDESGTTLNLMTIK